MVATIGGKEAIKLFKKILLCSDGSPHSLRAARYARALAEKFDGAVEVVFIVNEEDAKSDAWHHLNTLAVEQARKDKIQAVEEVLKRANLEYKLKIFDGDPGPAIVEYANKEVFDCVVIGSRGLNKIQSLLLGSVSNKVVKQVECPVLVIK